jgi:beta-ureidopropionase / N-carbamoyl-L-amino-acid hydrolase
MTPTPVSALSGRVIPDIALAERIFDELRRRTEAGRGVSRASYGLGEQIAHDIVRREAEALRLSMKTDAAANFYATLPGACEGPALMIGSHLDSVPLGGNYDGAAGVLLGLAVLSGLVKAGVKPPCPVTLMAIRAEESAWFSASYIGSRAAFGRISPEELDGVRRAGDGIRLRDAIAAAGGAPDVLAAGDAALDPASIRLFIEPHIEQGPVLLAQDMPVGIVTGIRGSFRYRYARCRGAYAHSGTTPREERQDAVRAVARLVVELDAAWERRAAAGEDLTITVGQFTTDADEASFSKIAGDVRFSIDVRGADSATLASMQQEVGRLVAAVEAREGVRFELGRLTTSEPARMSPDVVTALGTAARAAGVPHVEMPCGAGHDAAVFAQMGVPTGMIFIRNANGSHNPDEDMAIADFAAAARVLMALVLSPPPAP